MRLRWRLVFYGVLGLVPLVFLAACIVAALFLAAAVLVGPSSASREDKKIEQDVQHGVAYHEAGHAVVFAYLCGPESVRDVVVFTALDDDSFGVMHMKSRNQLSTADDLMREASVFMAGRAADVVINGAATNGAGSDLGYANRIIWNKYLVSGLGGSLLVRERSKAPDELTAKVEKDLDDANACAEAIIRENREAVTVIGDAVMEQKDRGHAMTLSGDAARELLKKHPLKLLPPDVQAKLMPACTPSLAKK